MYADDYWPEDQEEDQNMQQDEAASIAVAPCDDVPYGGGELDIAVSVNIPDSTQRVPVDICCVVDTSGSMGSEASEAEDGTVRDDGLTVLDIVKHAVKTVLKALKDDDRLAIVAFHERARTPLVLTEMTPKGQQQAVQALDSLQPGGQTNIWAGLLASMEALRGGWQASDSGASVGRLQACLLLTDGQPNVVPPRGHLAELSDYKDMHPDFHFQLNTFGFGYTLDSELLLGLAKEGHGTYAFIPDAVIVGTTFVNSVANVLSTLAQRSTINLMPRGGSELVGPVSGGFDELEESWGRVVALGPLQYGQQRDLIVKVRVPPRTKKPYLDVVLTYSVARGGTARVSTEAVQQTHTHDAAVARCRADVISTGYAAISAATRGRGKEAGEMVTALCSRVGAAAARFKTDRRLAALWADVEGRVSKALRGKERFNRWGKHYLRALIRSHQLQVCTNFMDPGLQPYGGTLFRELREKGDSIFLSLPPPQPSWIYCTPRPGTATRPSSVGWQSSQPPPADMHSYYAGAGGGCFAPSSKITRVTSGSCSMEVPVEEIRAGDILKVADEGMARVRCVVRIARDALKPLVMLPGGLRITPRHPVLIGGRWQFPRDVPGAAFVPDKTGYVYNLVLDRCHILPVDGVESATWGHGLQGDVIEHPFFGTRRVVDALATLEGWEAGFVDVSGACRDRDGEVVALRGKHCRNEEHLFSQASP